MSATKSGVTADHERIAVAKQLAELAATLLSDKKVVSAETLQAWQQAFQATNDGFGFTLENMKPNTIAAFLTLANRSEGMFNQLASELTFYALLDQLEELCFLQADNLPIVQPFIEELYANEVAANPFSPPKDFLYSPVEEAVEAYRKIFGSSMKANSVINLAKATRARKDSEGIAIWLKLSTIAKLFGVKDDPLLTTDEGRAAYARIVNLFVPEVGKSFTSVRPKLGGFKNWRENQLSANHIILTPAGIRTWGLLDNTTDDDFCFSPAGATTGITYAGHSERRSRVKVVLARDQFGQDCLMSGGTLATQPERMSKYKHLGIDCPANAYSPDVDGQFDDSVLWCFNDGRLLFGSCWARGSYQRFGSAVGFFS